MPAYLRVGLKLLVTGWGCRYRVGLHFPLWGLNPLPHYDLIQIWKTIHGHSRMNPSMFQPASTNPRYTRCTNKKFNLAKPFGRLEVRTNFFSVRAVDGWNKLPEVVQNADTLDDFKRGYDKFVHNITWNDHH